MPRIRHLRFEPLNVELTEPFGIATGAQHRAENVLCTAELEDGSIGYGEAAPFFAVSGETQAQTLDALAALGPHLAGEDAGRWRQNALVLKRLAPDAPAARAAIETALLDAYCRALDMSAWRFFGGADTTLESDITITTGSEEHASTAARRAAGDGFSTLKLKVGALPTSDDARRILAVLEAAPDAKLVLDANAALTAEQAFALLDALGTHSRRVVLFEQPVAADDIDGLRQVHARMPVAADESAKCARDVALLGKARAVDVINIKITKSGVAEAVEMIATARAHGLGLMIGGMVETRLAMTLSACLAAGSGGFSFVDLDTPLFMKSDPFRGGYAQNGARIALDTECVGLGVEPLPRTG